MPSLNRAQIIGRVGKDPETRYTSGGTAVSSFSVATSRTWKDKAGNKQEKTTWDHGPADDDFIPEEDDDVPL